MTYKIGKKSRNGRTTHTNNEVLFGMREQLVTRRNSEKIRIKTLGTHGMYTFFFPGRVPRQQQTNVTQIHFFL